MTRFDNWLDQEVYDELDEDGAGLTPWEIDFVEDVGEKLRAGEDLSPAQSHKLRQIAEDRCP